MSQIFEAMKPYPVSKDDDNGGLRDAVDVEHNEAIAGLQKAAKAGDAGAGLWHGFTAAKKARDKINAVRKDADKIGKSADRANKVIYIIAGLLTINTIILSLLARSVVSLIAPGLEVHLPDLP